MTNSLRDQLLKAGLVSKKQLQKTRTKPKKRGDSSQSSAEQKRREEELRALSAHKKARDRALNEERNRQRQAQEMAEWARQLMRAHAIDKQPPAEQERPFHFTIGNKVHQLYLAGAQREALAAGKLGIFWFDGQYHLLPAEQAQRIHERLGRRVWLASLVEPASPEEEDPAYAQYKVPDDLIW